MAISPTVRAALQALSYPDVNIKKNYRLHRSLTKIAHYPYLRPLYRMWDHKVRCGGHDVPVRIFRPDGEGPLPVLLFFHGGGWVTGSIDSYSKVCMNMARLTGHMVVSVDYRLAPEHKFPAAPEDCYSVAREIFAGAALPGADARRVTLIGDSAGGNLAAAVSLMARDRGEFLPQRQILLYPATYNDHTDASPYDSVRRNGTGYLLTSKRICDYMELYMSGPDDLKNPYFAPLLAKDFSNQPRTLLITAQYDPLRDEGEAYGRKLLDAGNHVEMRRITDGLHGFFSLPPVFPQVRDCYEYINKFLSEVTDDGPDNGAGMEPSGQRG